LDGGKDGDSSVTKTKPMLPEHKAPGETAQINAVIVLCDGREKSTSDREV
jgi:hypothetical protein